MFLTSLDMESVLSVRRLLSFESRARLHVRHAPILVHLVDSAIRQIMYVQVVRN
jgi:hypothetical protein